jgi:hypothetical protein
MTAGCVWYLLQHICFSLESLYARLVSGVQVGGGLGLTPSSWSADAIPLSTQVLDLLRCESVWGESLCIEGGERVCVECGVGRWEV